MVIKQCTKLLPYDTSLYTVYAVFNKDREGISEIDLKNDHISKEMRVYIDEKGIVCTDHQLPQFWTPYLSDQKEEVKAIKGGTEYG